MKTTQKKFFTQLGFDQRKTLCHLLRFKSNNNIKRTILETFYSAFTSICCEIKQNDLLAKQIIKARFKIRQANVYKTHKILTKCFGKLLRRTKHRKCLKEICKRLFVNCHFRANFYCSCRLYDAVFKETVGKLSMFLENHHH